MCAHMICKWKLMVPLKMYHTISLYIGDLWSVYASEKWAITGSGSGLSPIWHQTFTWTNDHFLSIEPLEVWLNFIEVSSKIQISSFNKMYLKIVTCKNCHPFCLLASICEVFTLKATFFYETAPSPPPPPVTHPPPKKKKNKINK